MDFKLDQITNFFGKVLKKPTVESHTDEPSIEDLKKLPDPAEYFSQTYMINHVDNDQELNKTFKNIHYEIGKIGDNFRQLGVNDGQFGVHESTMQSIVGNVSQSTQAYIETIFLGHHDAIKIDLQAKQSTVAKVESDFDTCRENLNKVNAAKNWKPSKYSPFSCILYLVSGFGLILSDIVLSFQITKNGFALEHSLEQWGMAIGIALATIYVKYFFDKYLLPPMERSVSAFKQENLPGVNDRSRDIIQVRLIWFLRFVFNTVVLAFFLVTIYKIGEFRFEYLEGENQYMDPPVEFTEITEEAFLLISLLLPIIGGICSAIGIRILENILFYRDTRRKFNKQRKELDRSQNELNLRAKKLKNFENYVNWCKLDGPFINNTAKFFYACYVHGYEFGFQKRNAGMDLFDRAKELRKYQAAREARNKLVTLLNNYKPELNTAV